MTAVLLAGGLGTRLSEEAAVRPKPMAEVGGQPIPGRIPGGRQQRVRDLTVLDDPSAPAWKVW